MQASKGSCCQLLCHDEGISIFFPKRHDHVHGLVFSAIFSELMLSSSCRSFWTTNMFKPRQLSSSTLHLGNENRFWKISNPIWVFSLQHSWHELKQGERNGVFWCVSLSWSQNIDPFFGGQWERASGMQAAFAVLVGAPLAAAVPSVLLLLPRFSRMHFTHDPFFGDSVLTFYFCVFFLTHSNWLNHRAHTPAHRVIVINV